MLPESQGQGIGRQLLNTVLDYSKEAGFAGLVSKKLLMEFSIKVNWFLIFQSEIIDKNVEFYRNGHMF